MAAHWIVERTQHPRFPYRIRIEQDGRPLLAVRAQHRWPGPGANVFCLRETSHDEAEPLEPIERVPVAHVKRLGRKLSVTLDRMQRKRCEFLRIEKQRADGSGTIEQMFFRTEGGMRAHRASGRVELVPQEGLHVVIDSSERYPWRFPGAEVSRRRLPVGDYAVLEEERIVAIVERKSLQNFLKDVGEIKGLHQQLTELGSYPRAAMLVEAQYADLGRKARIGRWPSAHLLRVVGELAAMHPAVPVVFAGSRKLANVWTQRYFAAALAAAREPAAGFVKQAVMRFEPSRADGGLDTRIRRAALLDLGGSFTIGDLRGAVPEAEDARIRRVLHALRREGRIACSGRGRAARWLRVEDLPPDGAG